MAEIDDTMLYHEFYHYMKEKVLDSASELLTEPDFYERPFKEVEKEYADIYRETIKKIL